MDYIALCKFYCKISCRKFVLSYSFGGLYNMNNVVSTEVCRAYTYCYNLRHWQQIHIFSKKKK